MKKEKILNDLSLSDYEKQLKEFFKNDARNANHYFSQINYKLTHDAAFESKIKFQLFYLNLICENQIGIKINTNTLLKRYLSEFIQSFKGNEEYDALLLHICGEILKICHNLTNKINNTHKSYWDIADLYHTAISFLLNQKSIDPACRLLIAKADLYHNKLSDSKSAVLCLNKILQIKYHQHLLDDIYCQNYNLIIESLKKLQENTNDDEDKDVYSKLISLLNKCEKEKTYLGIEFVSLAKHIQAKNKPMLSKQLYYIGQIIHLRHEKLHNIENTNYSSNFSTVLSFWVKELRNKSDLFLAIQKNDLEQVQQLLSAGISFEDINAEGLTPLTYAVKLGHFKIVQSLIKFGAKVNEIIITDDKIIDAPIYFAVKSKNTEMAKLLLGEKADIKIVNSESHSLLYIAAQNKDKNMVQLLKRAGAEPLNKSETDQLKKDPIYLQASSIEDLNKLLVSFNNGSQKNKIFCVHPITGEVMAYRKFADEIREKDPQRPVWGINSPAYFDNKNLPTTIQGIASLYISAIKQKQKQGPYILCGWSFGGLIAYEIAYQLAKMDEPVILLGLFDTYSPQILQTMEQKKFAKYLLTVITSLRHLFKEQLLQLDEEYLAQFTNEKQIDVAIEHLEKHQGTKTANVNKMIQLIKINLHAALKYQPIQDDCTPFVTCFNTIESIQECGCADLGWSTQTMGKVIVNKLNCTHNEILSNKETVTELADYILGHYQVVESDDAILEIKTNVTKMKNYQNFSQVLSTNDVKKITVFAQQLHKGLFRRPPDVDSYFSDNNNKHQDNNHSI